MILKRNTMLRMTEANHLKALIHEPIKEFSEFPVSGATESATFMYYTK